MKGNWRHGVAVPSRTVYIKRFASCPVYDYDYNRIWFKPYYKKFVVWGGAAPTWRDFIECIDEAEYIVRRLTESY
jgi:hypothetical protein